MEEEQVTIIIRTKPFIVPKVILLKAELFENLFNDTEVTGPIILNQSPKLFKYVLEALYDNTYPYPIEYKSELDKYLVPLDYINIMNFVDSSNQIKELKLEIENMKKQLMSHTCKCKKCDATTFYDHTRGTRECGDHRQCKHNKCNELCFFGKLYCSQHVNGNN